MNRRIKSIDIIRGLAVFLMVIVNTPGSWKANYPQLIHAQWHGITLADFVLPFFILSLGVAIPISIDSKLSKGKSTINIILSILKRSVLLILFGLYLNYLANPDFESIRIMGVLQRLGITYLASSLIYMSLRKLYRENKKIIFSLIGISVFIIVGYYIMAKPYGFKLEGSLAQIVDMNILGNHLYKPDFDPEGLLTTIVSISSATLGCAMGCIITERNKKEKSIIVNIAVFGFVCIIGGIIFNELFPYNKRLWSSSYILLTTGVYSTLLAMLYYISDIKKRYKIFTPIIALGSSPIFIYMMTEMISKTVMKINIYSDILQETAPLYKWITYEMIYPYSNGIDPSFIFSIVYLLIWTSIMMLMYKKKIFIKI